MRTMTALGNTDYAKLVMNGCGILASCLIVAVVMGFVIYVIFFQ